METSIDPEPGRALTERLVACSSVSPDPGGESQCAALIRAALPTGIESGEWRIEDGRPVVWARIRGDSARTLVLLAHYDTVGIEDYAALDDPVGTQIAFHPRVLRERLMALDPGALPAAVVADLAEERRVPGTWMFGRGALDMKSGIAAGIAALELLAHAPDRAPPPGQVVWVVCPDEENQSAGMLRAVEELVSMREREGLALVGAMCLDYGEEPVAYQGVAGKILVGLSVFGAPTHVGNPFAGVDAVQLAAAIVTRLTTSPALVDHGEGGGGVPAVALRLRDLKPRYDVQTALEVDVELNLVTRGRALAQTLEILRAEIATAMRERDAAMSALAEGSGHAALGLGESGPRVLTYPELAARAGLPSGADPLLGEARDVRLATFDRIRALVRGARLAGPAVVLALLPPFYPHSAPRPGGFAHRLRPLLEAQGIEARPLYPFISDACYMAWRGGSTDSIEAHLPALGREYRLPISAARALDLDVVNLGPWGRDAHGLYERVHAPYAFGILPRRVAQAVRQALEAGEAKERS